MRLDTAIALGCLIATMTIASWSLSHIIASDRESNSALDAMLIEGKTSYSLMSGASCFGTAETAVNFRSASVADWSSNFTTSLNDHSFSTSIQGRVGINKLGQVNGISIALANEYSSLRIESRSIAPIELSIRGHVGSHAIARSINVPGPIVLHPVGTGQYKITLPRSLGLGRITPTSHIVSSLKQTLALTILESKDSTYCKEKGESLHLDPLVSQFGGLFSLLGSFSLPANEGDDL